MRIIVLVVTIAAAIACSGGTTVHIDAGKQDGMGSGPPCTGAAFDPCTDPSQCMSANCHNFMSAGLYVCTAACTPGMNSTCPVDASGSNALCNTMGICKPAVANNCSR